MAYNGIPYLRGPNEAIDYDLTMREELRKCAKSYKYFVENYIKIDDNSGSLKLIQLYDYQKNLLNIVHNNKMTVCKFPRQPIFVDTKVKTIDGWKTIGTLEVGDFVYDVDENPTRVMRTTEVFEDAECYKLFFDNEEIICDSQHEWPVSHDSWGDKIELVKTETLFDMTGMYVVSKNKKHYIHKIEHTERVPVKCIETDNIEQMFLLSESMILCSNCGKTTSMACYIVWCIIFRKRYKVGVAADKDETALEIIDRIKTAYESLPYWMQQGVKKWDAHKVLLENGSKVDASATTKKTFRGKTYNLVLLDEFAFVDQNIADPFYTSIYPTVSKSDPTIPIPLQTKMVIISTPNGLNHFHKLYDDADKGKSDFKAVEIKWNDVPGRDDKFKETTLRNIGEDRWEQEYNGSFLGSSTSLVPASKLKTLVFSEPKEFLQDISIWKPPVEGHSYFISCDVCQGKGLDYHAASVIDITAVPYEVVANFHNNTLDTMMYPSVIFELAKKYNEAFVLIELNNNGKQVSDILYYELEYENVLSTMTRGRAGQVLTVESSTAKGVTMTKPVKSTGCSNLKSLIMSDQLILNDHKYLKELSTFSIQGGQYKAENGSHDDLVMSLVTFSWATTETYFADLLDVNIRQELFEQRIKQLEEDLIPFGVLGNMAAEDEDELMF